MKTKNLATKKENDLPFLTQASMKQDYEMLYCSSINAFITMKRDDK